MSEETTNRDDRLRVAFCIHELDPGGAERALFEIVSRLDKSRFEPRVFCLAEPGELVSHFEAADVSVVCFGRRGWRTGFALRSLIRELRKFEPQVMQTFLFQANVLGRFAAKLAGCPRILSGVRVADRRGNWRFLLERWTRQLVWRHVCVSEGVAEFFGRKSGVPTHQIAVIPNGVDFSRFADAPSFDWRDLGLPSNARVILSVGRIDPQKNPTLLATAFRRIAADFPSTHLVFVGDGPLRFQLESLVSKSGDSDRIHIAGRRDDVRSLLKSADVFALTSRWEGMPNVLLEAMAAGTPIVTTDVEGVRDLQRHGAFGRVADPDPISVADALSATLRDPSAAQSLASRAQETVRRHYQWEDVTRAYEDLFAHP